jgi:hypothetical protein
MVVKEEENMEGVPREYIYSPGDYFIYLDFKTSGVAIRDNASLVADARTAVPTTSIIPIYYRCYRLKGFRESAKNDCNWYRKSGPPTRV